MPRRDNDGSILIDTLLDLDNLLKSLKEMEKRIEESTERAVDSLDDINTEEARAEADKLIDKLHELRNVTSTLKGIVAKTIQGDIAGGVGDTGKAVQMVQGILQSLGITVSASMAKVAMGIAIPIAAVVLFGIVAVKTFGNVTEVIQQLITVAIDLGKQFVQMGMQIAKMTVRFVQTTIRALRNLYAMLVQTGQRYLMMAGEIDEVRGSAVALQESIRRLGQEFTSLFIPQIQSTIAWLTNLVNIIRQVIAALRGQSTYTKIVAKDLKDAEEAGGAAAGSLAAFDELDVLQQPGGGGGAGDVFGEEEVPIDEKWTELADKIARAWELAREKMQEFWDTLKPLRDFLVQTGTDFYNSFLKPVAEWVVGEGWDEFIRITNDLMENSDWDGLAASLDRFYQAAAKLTIAVFKGLLTFYDRFLRPIAEWTINEAVPKFLDSLSTAIEKIDWENLNTQWGVFLDALTRFTLLSLDTLLTFVTDILIPLGTWVIDEALPRFFETLATVLDILSSVLEALKPLWDWFYENVLVPVATWAGEKFLTFWDWLNERLERLSTWMQENPEIIRAFFVVVLGLGILILIGLVSILSIVLPLLGLLTIVFGLLGVAALAIVIAVGLVIAIIGALMIGIGLLIGIIVKGLIIAFEWLKEKGGEAWEWIKEKAAILWDWIEEVWGSFKDWLTEKVIEPVKDLFWEMFVHIYVAAAIAWEIIKAIWRVVWGWFKSKVIDPLWEKFTELWERAKELAMWAWNGIKATWEKVRTWFTSRVIEPVKRIFGTLWALIRAGARTAWNGIKTIWNVAKGFFDKFVIEPIKRGFTIMWGFIRKGAQVAWTGIKTVWGALSGWITSNIVDPIARAWESVRSVFQSVWDGIVSYMKPKLNTIIDYINKLISGIVSGMNSVISALNGIKISIPSWVPKYGGQSWGMKLPKISAPSIPKLAEGAVIPPRSEFLAIMGDQRRGRNIEAPEGLIREILQEELANMRTEVVVRFDGTLGALIRELKPHIDQENARIGTSLIRGMT